MDFTSQLENNFSILQDTLRLSQSFDLICRDITVGGRAAKLIFIDGFTKDEIWQKILAGYSSLTSEQMPDNPQAFAALLLSYGEIDIMTCCEDVLTPILSGVSALVIDGYSCCFLVDCRTYPARSVQEPEKDKVLRGSRDGFTETVIFNTALIRRRIRDPRLTMAITSIGSSSHTDVACCYMDGRVSPALLTSLKERLQQIEVDALTMNQESLAECLFSSRWINPLPKFRFTERPDTAAAAILEGSLVILVDNSPAAMVLPSSAFDIIEEADDYYFPPVTGTYLRLSRLFITLVSIFLIPLWILCLKNPELVPSDLRFLLIQDEISVPILAQFLILEMAIDGLRLAAVNTPSVLSTPLSVIAGIAVGEYSVKSGWFNSETMLYMAFVTLSSYSQSSIEMGYAIKFFRILCVLLTWFLGIPGFLGGILVILLAFTGNRTIAGTSYLYPLIPFTWKEVKKRLLRGKLTSSHRQQP